MQGSTPSASTAFPPGLSRISYMRE